MSYLRNVSYVIPGKPVTKKNSMQMARNPKTGKLFPVPSKQYKVYEKAAKEKLFPLPKSPIDRPVNVRVIYYISLNKDGSIPKNLPDLTNLLEATDDILVKYAVVKDDNVSIVASHDGSHVVFTGDENYSHITITPLEGCFHEDDFEEL